MKKLCLRSRGRNCHKKKAMFWYIFKKLAFPPFRRLCRPVLCQLLPGARVAASYGAARRVNAVAQPIHPFGLQIHDFHVV